MRFSRTERQGKISPPCRKELRSFAARSRRAELVCLALFCVPPASDAAETPAAGVWGNVRVVEDLRIGSFDGADETIFGRISYLAVGPEGSIYVADGQLETLRVYDAGGRFVRTIGRKGEAPGEFLLILGMTVLPGGNLALYDGRNQRITIFHPGGAVLRDFRISNSFFADDMLHHNSAGNLFLWSSEPRRERPGGWPREFLSQISPTGEILGRIPLPETNHDAGMMLVTPEGSQYSFNSTTLWAWSPLGYLVVAQNEAYSIEMHLPDAEPRRIEHSYDPVAVRPEEKEQWLSWAAYFRKRELERGQPAPEYHIPERKPAFKEIHVGDDGRIWLQRYVAAEKHAVPAREPGDERPLFPWREPQVFDVFESDGTFLGNIAIPRSTRILFRRGSQLWGVYTDDSGEHVVRLRIESR